MDKSKAYIVAFLAFCVLSSKNIIIYNEETIVAFCFFAFVFFIFRHYGHTIQDSLNERGSVIKLELQNVGFGRLASLDELLQEHQKLSTLHSGFDSVTLFTIRELVEAIRYGGVVLKTLFTNQMEQKLKTASFTAATIQQRLQQFMSSSIVGLVHLRFQHTKKN